jgi:hypothetical protein
MFLAVLLLMFVPMLQQDPPKENKPPKRGDVVIAKGCVKGGVLEAADVSGPGGTGAGLVDIVTFRLTGDKKALQEIKRDHEGHVDIVTGELKTDLPTTTETQGKKIGKTGITVGVGGSRGMMPPPPPPMPVLKVTAFEHSGVSCR